MHRMYSAASQNFYCTCSERMWHLPIVVEEPIPYPGPVELLGHDALEGGAEDGAAHFALQRSSHEQVDVVHTLVQVFQGVYTLEGDNIIINAFFLWNRVQSSRHIA